MKSAIRAIKKLHLKFVDDQLKINKNKYVIKYLEAVKHNLCVELDMKFKPKERIYRDYNLNISKILVKAGLSHNQAIVYAFMLDNDHIRVKPLLRLGIPRTEGYHLLKSLYEKNIVGVSEDKFKTYYVIDRKNPLKGFIQTRTNDLKHVKQAELKLKDLLQ